jgi:hypothetical protein
MEADAIRSADAISQRFQQASLFSFLVSLTRSCQLWHLVGHGTVQMWWASVCLEDRPRIWSHMWSTCCKSSWPN